MQALSGVCPRKRAQWPPRSCPGRLGQGPAATPFGGKWRTVWIRKDRASGNPRGCPRTEAPCGNRARPGACTGHAPATTALSPADKGVAPGMATSWTHDGLRSPAHHWARRGQTRRTSPGRKAGPRAKSLRLRALNRGDAWVPGWAQVQPRRPWNRKAPWPRIRPNHHAPPARQGTEPLATRAWTDLPATVDRRTGALPTVLGENPQGTNPTTRKGTGREAGATFRVKPRSSA